MKRKLVFDILGAILSLVIIAVLIETYVRVIADDGMEYDLEMWKYARDVKQLLLTLCLHTSMRRTATLYSWVSISKPTQKSFATEHSRIIANLADYAS